MWTCHKCGKPVYFAERKQSLGYDWHPECLRCEECGKRLNPGQHAEHKGVPYCHVPCYGALFGPTLFGHGSAVEAHKSFGRVENRPGIVGERSHLEAKLKLYNQYYEGKSQELKFRERNGKLILEGVLQIFWGVNNPIHLKEDDDQRTHVQVRKRNSYRLAINNGMEDDTIRPFVPGSAADAHDDSSSDEDKPSTDKNCKGSSEHKTDEVDRASNQQTGSCLEASKQQLPNSQDELKGSTGLPNEKQSSPGKDASQEILKTDKNHLQVPDSKEVPEVRIRKMASSRSRTKLKRRCSINGHYYNRETRVFTPPFGSATNVWITSMVNSPEVINMLLDKFRIEDNPQDFALYVVRDNGETRKILEHEYPLLVRVMLGPHEDVAKVFIMDTRNTSEISNEVAQFLNLADPELRAILQRFHEEEEREAKKIKLKFREMKRLMKYRLEVLKKQKQ